MPSDRLCWLDGAYLPLADARVSALDRGFLFADGVYEVTAVLDGRLVDSAAHMARLERSAAELDIPLPLPVREIEAIERALVSRNAVDQGTVYLHLTRGGGGERDFLPAAGIAPTLLLFTQAKDILSSPAAERGVAVVTMPDLRWARRDIKSIALLAQVMAKRAAMAAGAEEAWLVEAGMVTEGASSTALIVAADGTLVTRPDGHAVLPGCTAAAVRLLAERDGVAIERRSFTVAEALASREAVLTSASNFVLPVVSIDGRPIGDGLPGPIARRLRRLYVEAARTF